jgi:hypothetical protein
MVIMDDEDVKISKEGDGGECRGTTWKDRKTFEKLGLNQR